MKTLIAAGALLTLLACSPAPKEAAESAAPAHASPAPVAPDIPAGAYTLDKTHASLLFRVSHLGFSNYTAQFKTWNANLNLDPQNLTAAKVTATVDARSLDLDAPPKGFLDELRGPNWLDAGKYPEMKFTSTSVEPTGPDTARITGDFTMHGATKPVTLEAKFNGGYAGNSYDPNARIGFSAKGVLKRSEFGVSAGIPAPGTTMGVSDVVEIIIEAEFTGPPWKAPATPQ